MAAKPVTIHILWVLDAAQRHDDDFVGKS